MSRNTNNGSAIEALAESGFDKHPFVIQFRTDLIMHTHFQSCLDQIAERVQYGEQQSMTAVVGPTASGKTAVVREFVFQFERAMKRVDVERRSSLLCLNLAASESGPFKWKDDFYIPALAAMEEPCIAHKIDIAEVRSKLSGGDNMQAFSTKNLKVVDYRELFYKSLSRARVKAAFIDEADHFRRPASKSGIFGQYDSLKSRSNSCESHFVLFGTTNLIDIFHQSGQISKRVFPIWLNPFERSEMRDFGAAILSIAVKIKVPLGFDVESKLGSLFDRTLGVYGLVHDWFDRALVRAIRQSSSKITWADMEAVALHSAQLVGIVEDLIRYRRSIDSVQSELKQKSTSYFLLCKGSSDAISVPESAKGARVKPGVRRPGRDPVAT